ncbi:hypothetical protein C9374_013406 [Naegleria lovaniensis]|uniref:Uncharacterized protein n=1 Tax=Naegleria lovaniensis TaxID=51637 RepID=A0AA88H0I3_NAELO|nr:uncharacterized protein C9374_013406 [Naegleria lovaniensis]KAG2391921.1 hypothetical protein C9374_013406 [Naegleria lovaniensis]
MHQDNTPYAQFDSVHTTTPYPPQPQQYYNTTTTDPNYLPYSTPPPQYYTPTTAGVQTTSTATTGFIQPHYDSDYTKKKNDDTCLLLFIIGFFIPLVWIFLFFVTRDSSKYSHKARTMGNVGLGLIIASCMIYVVMIIIIVVVSTININKARN